MCDEGKNKVIKFPGAFWDKIDESRGTIIMCCFLYVVCRLFYEDQVFAGAMLLAKMPI